MRITLAATAVTLVAALTATPTLPATADTSTAHVAHTAAAPALTAREALATLPVKGRAPMTGYDRDLFGQAWSDIDRNGCDQRNDVLRRDLTNIALKPGTRGCVVATGTLADPYTGRRIPFVRGPRSSEVQIDHVVALGDSWQTGAQQLTPAEREALANDFTNLLATDGPTNQAKGASNAASWLPANKAFRCTYVARQVTVKYRHRLWVIPAERDAIAAVLDTCPAEPLTP